MKLTGLELRKAACEALGYTSQPAYGHADFEWWNSTEQIEANFVCHCVEHLPAIESDSAISEPLFLEWLNTNGFEAVLTYALHSSISLQLYANGEEFGIGVIGATPSECRALAIVEASRKGAL